MQCDRTTAQRTISNVRHRAIVIREKCGSNRAGMRLIYNKVIELSALGEFSPL